MDLPAFDPFSDHLSRRLFDARTLLLNGQVDDRVAAEATARLTAMAAESVAPITVYVNARGGTLSAADALFDFLRFIAPRVRMVGTGWVGGPASLVFVAVPRDDRYGLPNARFQLYRPEGDRSRRDIVAEAEEVARTRERVYRVFSRATGQPLDRIEQDAKHEAWMNAEEALAYGLIGHLAEHRHDVA